jgi:hypothetical protein
VLHPGGALLRSDDGSGHAGPRADTRFHLTVANPGTHQAKVTLEVQHERPLSSALPRTAGPDALPERPTLSKDSVYKVTLRASCSLSGAITVGGVHSVLLQYPKSSPAAPPAMAETVPQRVIDPRVHGQLTADIMDLHALAMGGSPQAVALHLADIEPATGAHRIVGLLVLARELEGQAGSNDLLPPVLAGFAFAELRRCAEDARQHTRHERLALLRQAVIGSRARQEVPSLAHGLPGHGHWQHARQELCLLLATLLYRSVHESAIPALDVPPTGDKRGERDWQLRRLMRDAAAGPWKELTALLPSEWFGMWRTTRVQRPTPYPHAHGNTVQFLEIALGCLNALGRRRPTVG